MPESTKPGSKKKRPAWLSDEEHQPVRPVSRPGAKGPLAEDDTGELSSERREPAHDEQVDPTAEASTTIIPRVSVSDTGKRSGARQGSASSSSAKLAERLRANSGPAVVAALVLLVLSVLFWFLFLRGTGEEAPGFEGAPGGGMVSARPTPEDPFGGGPVRDSGVRFGALKQEGDEAELNGAGLDWKGSVTQKEGGAGETVTLEGPTAAQLERGFDLGASEVETGVYAVAQDSGQVLHVTTHTFVPVEDGARAEEMTLGTVYALDQDRLDGYAYYLDQREEGSNRVTRTYVRPGESSYRVSYEAPPGTGPGAEERNGAFVPLLVGWRGFGDESTREQEGGG